MYKCKLKKMFFLALSSLLVLSCEQATDVSGGIGGSGTGSVGNDISGYVQKGPFKENSPVTIKSLDANLAAKDIEVTTLNNLGFYEATIPFSGLIEVSAKGYFWNELRGKWSDHQIRISALYDTTLKENELFSVGTLNVNVLTHLTQARIRYLITQENLKFSDAVLQAEAELVAQLDELFIGDCENFGNLTLYNKKGSDEQGNAYLLAVTSALYQYLLNQIPSDVEDPSSAIDSILFAATEDFSTDGIFDLTKLIDELRLVIQDLDPISINENLASLIDGLEEFEVANINIVLDSDLDGEANESDDDDDGDGIPDKYDDEPYNSEIAPHQLDQPQIRYLEIKGLNGVVQISDEQHAFKKRFRNSRQYFIGFELASRPYHLKVSKQPDKQVCTFAESSTAKKYFHIQTSVLVCDPAPIISQVILNALVGKEDSIITTENTSENFSLYRTNTRSCDFLDFFKCENAQFDYLTGRPIVDNTLTLNKESYYTLGQGGKNLTSFKPVSHKKIDEIYSATHVYFKGKFWNFGGQIFNKASQKVVYSNEIWSSPDGISWVLEKEDGGFRSRGLQIVVTKDMLWMYSGDVEHSIWSSDDGINWTQINNNPPFSKREAPTLTSFNDRLYIIGGSVINEQTNKRELLDDVWTSSNGKDWQLESEGEVPARLGYATFVHENKLWLAGGVEFLDEITANYRITKAVDEIWSTIDGVEWLKEVENADFGNKLASISKFKGRFWLIGGEIASQNISSGYSRETAPATNEIWVSDDGLSWQIVIFDSSFKTKPVHELLADDKGLVLFGSVYRSDRVWRSVDGVHWGKLDGAYAKRFEHQTLVFKDKLLTIAGSTTERFLSSHFFSYIQNDVWASTNGVSWEELNSDAEFSRRNGHQSVVFKDRLWLFGGRQENYFNRAESGEWIKAEYNQLTNDIWSSDDAISWRLEKAQAAFSKRAGSSVVVFKDKLWLIAGYFDDPDFVFSADYYNDVWSSVDGLTWQLETDNALFQSRADHQTVVFDDRIWVIGGRSNAEDGNLVLLEDIWSSADGVTWREETDSADFGRRMGHAVTAFDNKLWLTGGYTRYRDGPFHDVWSSENGADWTLVSDSPGFRARFGHQLTVFKNKMWITGGSHMFTRIDQPEVDNTYQSYDDTWSSTDGINWRQSRKIVFDTQ